MSDTSTPRACADDNESYDAADEGPVTVNDEEYVRLYLEACQRAKDAGL